jgi:AraC family transcriptional regulator, transcriptional activator of the genes for pyochelin and ferripyochelin receptors
MTFSYNGIEAFAPSRDFLPELYWVPGGEILAYDNSQGKIVVQKLNCPSGQVFEMICRMDGQSKIRVQGKGLLLLTFVALQEDQYLYLEELGTIRIREGQYNLLYAPEFNLEILQENSKEYIGLGLIYPIHVLQEMAPYFPWLAAFLDKVHAGQSALLQPEHSWITGEIQDAVYRILHCPVNITSYPIYIDSLVKALLFHLLWQCVQQQPASHYSHYEVEGIYAARDMIRKNLRYHYVIPEIAQKVGLNEFKLKNGFREVFGNGVYEYLYSERMIEARSLLSDPCRSVKEVAALSGYRSVNSFIKAFKKKYSLTPGEFRKRA